MTIGLNLSGGEFGGTAGTHGYTYQYPTLSALQFYKNHGVDLVRIPFRWERVQDALGGPLDLSGDIALIKQTLVNAASLGMNVILDAHNYGRYKGVALGAAGGPTAAQFADFWKKMAIELKDYPALLGYDLMNEPNNMPTTTIWKESAQAATTAIRQVDMENVIYVEGTGWSAAHSWVKYNGNLIINDPANKIVYQAHGYYDDNNSGTYNETYEGEGAHPMIGVERLKPFVDWLKANDLKGMIGEFGVPSTDPRWLEVQKNAIEYMNANNLDGTAWGGGTWIGTDYMMYTARPGHADSNYMNLLENYFGEYKDIFGEASPVPPTTTLTLSGTVDGDILVGGLGNDTLKGLDGNDTLTGGAGADALDGGNGTDTASYSTSTVAVKIDLALATQSGGHAQGDKLVSIEKIIGSNYGDSLLGSSAAQTLAGGSGSDLLQGRGGSDTLDGGSGSDTASYSASAAAVDVDLARSSQLGGDAAGDKLVSIEKLIGSNYADKLYGSSSANTLSGGAGNDVLNGRGGADVLTGGSGNDKFLFGSASQANRDKITDLSLGDVLDFSAIDAKSNVDGNQAFLHIGTKTFTGVSGELRTYQSSDNDMTYIQGDLNGDKVADFTVELNGLHSTWSFIL